MNENIFRSRLAGRLGPGTINSYVGYCRRVERELSIDLDVVDLSTDWLENIRRGLLRCNVPPKNISHCLSAIGAYHSGPGTVGIAHPVRSPSAVEPRTVRSNAMPTAREVRDRSIAQLLRLYGEIMDELRDRKVIRTGNSPVGDYAELLCSKAFGWSLAGNSALGFDATDAIGTRYQIKARRLTAVNASRQLSAIRNIHKQNFDFVVGILFDSAFHVRRAAMIPRSIIASRSRHSSHTNSSIFILDDSVWELPGVSDVTEPIRAAANRLGAHQASPQR